MGVGLKGNTQTQINGGGGRVVGGGWSRSYGLVLMFAFAFGAAIFGVVTLHKLREKRIFSLVLKDKDLQLNSLHLHLQKEREYAKEAKRKNEDMKEKLYYLRNQKMELKGRILEMQSTISSLKEEHKVMELALEEKQDEIKLIIEKEQEVNKENRHRTAPTQVLKHKEAEIEDLRRNLDLPVKVWSVSTDDPSNPPVNLTTNVSIAQRDETELGENKENSVGLHERSSSSRDKKTLIRHADGRGNKSTTNGDGENATEGEDGRETVVRVANTREMNGEEQSQKLEVSQQGFGHGNTTNEKGAEQSQGTNTGVSQDNRGFGIVTQKTETIVNSGVDVQKPRHEGGDVKGTENKEPESISKRQFADDQVLGVHYEGSMEKMENTC